MANPEAVAQKVNVAKEMNASLAELIRSSMPTVKDGVEFVKGETPELVTQILHWEFVSYFLSFWIGLAIIFGCAYGMMYALKHCDDSDEIGFSMIGGMLVSITSLIFLVNLKWFQILVAPKLFLLEHMVRLLK